MKTLQYYSGDSITNTPATTGIWDGNIFTASNGTKWTVDPSESSPHPSNDGTGTHYLLPA